MDAVVTTQSAMQMLRDGDSYVVISQLNALPVAEIGAAYERLVKDFYWKLTDIDAVV